MMMLNDAERELETVKISCKIFINAAVVKLLLIKLTTTPLWFYEKFPNRKHSTETGISNEHYENTKIIAIHRYSSQQE